MSKNIGKSSIASVLGMQNEDSQDSKTQNTNAGKDTQGVPLTPKEQHQAQALDQHIQNFEESLDQRSNSELKQTAEQLESVERGMLLEKIDKELQTIKETVVQPGDAGAAAASASAGAASATLQDPVSV